MKITTLCCACAAGAVTCLSCPSGIAAQNEVRGEQARIAFADMGGVRNWKAEDRDTLFVQSRRGQWYQAELLGPCSGLPFAHTIGFVFEPDGSLDRFSSVVVDGQECQFKSLVKSAGPADTDTARKADLSSTDNSPASTSASASDEQGARADGREARIPFVHLGGIENWRAVDADTLYIEGRRNQWYRAELLGACPGLRFETAIGFVTRSIGGFDEFSSIVVDGRECHLKSLTESEPPPKKG